MRPEEQVTEMSAEKFAEIHERLTNGEYPQPMVVLRDAQALADEVDRLRGLAVDEARRRDEAYRALNDAYMDQIKRNNALLAQLPSPLETPASVTRLATFLVGMDVPPDASESLGTMDFQLRELDAPTRDCGRIPARRGARICVTLSAKQDGHTTCARWLASRFRGPILITFSDPETIGDSPESE